ncbi:MAG: hypothetical protein OEZ39_20330 [Gammaproteobacteria bacterium]|nr:hypothetical protein [Gammaproteobacteria bacterium]
MPIADYTNDELHAELQRRAALPRNNRVYGYFDSQTGINYRYKIKGPFLAAVTAFINAVDPNLETSVTLQVLSLNDDDFALNPDEWTE